ncbi:hypothetical protein, partial [Sandarakinorhabdus sp.]|uniref:hypothetical protein n=1 Tax=Sandarakinorhabdus sp. TaxID=1916663 RepID=UPI00333F624B
KGEPATLLFVRVWCNFHYRMPGNLGRMSPWRCCRYRPCIQRLQHLNHIGHSSLSQQKADI